MSTAPLRWIAVASLVTLSCGVEEEGLAPNGGGGSATGGVAGVAPGGGAGGTSPTGGSGGSVTTGGSAGSLPTGGGGTAGAGGSQPTGGSGGVAGGGGSTPTGGSGGTGGTPTYDPAWWDGAYKSRWPIHVAAPAALVQGFQVPLPVQAGSIDGASAPYDGWRIVRWDGSAWSEQARFIETVAGKQWIWFRAVTAVSASDDSYWLYAANASAPSPGTGTGVFELYSSLGQADTATWTSTGSVSYDGTRATLDGAGAGASLRTNNKTFGADLGVDFAMTVVTPLASASVWLCGGFQRQNDFTNQAPWILWISRSPGQIDVESYITPGNWKGGNVPPDVGNEHLYSVERFAQKNKFLYDLANKDANTWGATYTQALQIRFSAYNGSKIGVRFARVRKTVDPPPTATLGAKETYP
jgi:hypothetical protein